MKYRGSCHCKAVQFEVEAPGHIEVEDCNCSICAKSGYLHLIVPEKNFSLISGKDSITSYRFNTGIAEHKFCSICGIKPFYVPRSNPDGIAVNARCLDVEPESITIRKFDGKNWEKNAHKIAHKSK